MTDALLLLYLHDVKGRSDAARAASYVVRTDARGLAPSHQLRHRRPTTSGSTLQLQL